MKIEWDSEKEEINKRKHKISFDLAKNVFFDEFRIEIYDELHSVNEDRYNTIGLVNDVLFVVYTERKDSLRLISARLADKRERELYYESRENII
ncbi:MAG: BrnT family toxin [Eubacterium sp.]|nr:BrnT family toxin [Eubacterium sp.]